MKGERKARRPAAPAAVERVRGRRPDETSWRADALGRSPHTRMADELRLPAHDPDPERARLLCAKVSRAFLGDLSASLVALTHRDRQRAQTLAAYLRTLFDFALQPGLEGERLARINRWQFELERALESDEPGQPIFVAMRLEHLDRAWSKKALDAFGVIGRRVAIADRTLRDLDRLAAGICLSLPGLPATSAATDFAARLILILTRRSQLLAAASTPDRQPASPLDPRFEARADEIGPSELMSLESRLEEPGFETIPRRWRTALRFLATVADDFQGSSTSPKPLGAADRLRRLLRSFLRA